VGIFVIVSVLIAANWAYCF